MRICPSCGAAHHEQEYQRCEWCRFGAPMEAAFEEPAGNFHRRLGETMASFISDNLKGQGISRALLPVQQVPSIVIDFLVTGKKG